MIWVGLSERDLLRLTSREKFWGGQANFLGGSDTPLAPPLKLLHFHTLLLNIACCFYSGLVIFMNRKEMLPSKKPMNRKPSYWRVTSYRRRRRETK